MTKTQLEIAQDERDACVKLANRTFTQSDILELLNSSLAKDTTSHEQKLFNTALKEFVRHNHISMESFLKDYFEEVASFINDSIDILIDKESGRSSTG